MHCSYASHFNDPFSKYILALYFPRIQILYHIFLCFVLSYLNSAKVGDEIVITANTVKAGKTLAFLEAKITEKTSGKVIATATHIKFVKD